MSSEVRPLPPATHNREQSKHQEPANKKLWFMLQQQARSKFPNTRLQRAAWMHKKYVQMGGRFGIPEWRHPTPRTRWLPKVRTRNEESFLEAFEKKFAHLYGPGSERTISAGSS